MLLVFEIVFSVSVISRIESTGGRWIAGKVVALCYSVYDMSRARSRVLLEVVWCPTQFYQCSSEPRNAPSLFNSIGKAICESRCVHLWSSTGYFFISALLQLSHIVKKCILTLV